MAIQRSFVVEAPVDDVFAWFSRPGAFQRLAPPWQPVAIDRETASLRDGTAELSLPAGLRWVSRHDPAGFAEGRRFVDESVAAGPRSALAGRVPWRHTHEFEAVGDDRTLVIDRIETPVPAALLDPMLAYRHRQLAGDLAAHRRASDAGLGRLTVAVSGASGLVGSALTAFLTTGGHRVIRLVRGEPTGPDERRWDTAHPAPDLLQGCDAVVHLAGASIAGRFTEEHKRAVRDSRIEPTRKLSEAAAASGVETFVSASAVGVYGADRGEEVLTEDSGGPEESDFLSGVVADWEDAAHAGADESAGPHGMRVVNIRTGIVQSPAGGTLALLRPLFAAGVGGRLGHGQQWMSWIGLDDLVDVYHRALWDEELSGPVNAVAPAPVRNTAYTKSLARVLRRPALVPVPRFGPALLLGEEGADELALACQHVVPLRLRQAGHRYRHPDLEPALRHLLGKAGARGE
ncbi:TIGR01777 family oxidoreductase [Zhihengliuella salsuginis]|uniref:Nucleoside-diphosphate sugar epimerase n=1 Tax=Zhihengliuella salsuginis TaxID=578222 RepID=A0ABQ3GG18_9MICC|nr:TIGR01777 family oxidoreductase [Zhihengliuella salsuginis]GHD04867.1 nucleoside-diphosphate sugar epimerase [Zhihengliuella salsuginis]